jgi:hypothetical protein
MHEENEALLAFLLAAGWNVKPGASRRLLVSLASSAADHAPAHISREPILPVIRRHRARHLAEVAATLSRLSAQRAVAGNLVPSSGGSAGSIKDG